MYSIVIVCDPSIFCMYQNYDKSSQAAAHVATLCLAGSHQCEGWGLWGITITVKRPHHNTFQNTTVK